MLARGRCIGSLAAKPTARSLVAAQVEAGLQRLAGPGFDVRAANPAVEFKLSGNVLLTVPEIDITRRSDNATLAHIEGLSLVSNIGSFFRGDRAFDSIVVNYADIDAKVAGLSQSEFLLPKNFKTPLKTIGDSLNRLDQALEGGDFRGITLKSLTLRGKMFGRRLETPLELRDLSLARDADQSLQLSATAESEISLIAFGAKYLTEATGRKALRFGATGINLNEWLASAQSQDGVLGVDGLVEFRGQLLFAADGSPLDPRVQLRSGAGALRLAKKAITPIDSLDLDFQIFVERNQVELNRSQVKLGKFKGIILGGIKPADDIEGYHGPLLYDFIVDPGFYEPTRENEPVVPAAFKAAGTFDRSIKLVNVDRIVFETIGGTVYGSGDVNLAGETPAVYGELKTDGISVLALKQFWPYFVGGPARKWVHKQVIDGQVVSGSATANIPPGILFRLSSGAKLTPEQFSVNLELEQLSFLPFGELPAIQNAKGSLRLAGMQIIGEMESGGATDGLDQPVDIQSAKFYMPDYGEKLKTGEVSMEVRGDIKSIAQISERRPLRVMERLKVEAGQFSGTGYADIVVKFPIKKKIQYEEVDWNVLLDLKDGSSAKPLQGRDFRSANLLIDANPKGANVVGKANIDGVPARIRFTEPIGKSGEVSRSREIRTVLNDKQRSKLGFDLGEIVKGPISVVIKQTGSQEKHVIDFSKAELTLPWIGWRKGKGIKAKGGFDFSNNQGRLKLSNFYLVGPGFGTNGSLEFDKKGLVNADLKEIKLNRFDDFSVKVEREDNVYNINASGLSFDTRGLINLLLNEGNFTKKQGKNSVNLVANFSKILGFNDREMENAILLYQGRAGVTDSLDFTASSTNGRNRVNASRQGSATVFSIVSDDAGSALAFTDIYTKMRGGNLQARLEQSEDGPYVGPVSVSNFKIANESRIERLVPKSEWEIDEDTGRRIRKQNNDPSGDQIVPFTVARANIKRGKGYMELSEAIVRSRSLGFTMQGTLYDANDNMNILGMFMPSNDMNIALRRFPLIGDILAGGKENIFFGIRYLLSGPRKNPKLTINPSRRKSGN